MVVKSGEDGMKELLADPEVEAVFNVLPAHVSLEV